MIKANNQEVSGMNFRVILCIDANPAWAKEVEPDNEVEINTAQLSNGMYPKDGQMIGEYSAKRLLEQQSRRRS